MYLSHQSAFLGDCMVALSLFDVCDTKIGVAVQRIEIQTKKLVLCVGNSEGNLF
jgi:hypothetical protein